MYNRVINFCWMNRFAAIVEIHAVNNWVRCCENILHRWQQVHVVDFEAFVSGNEQK